MADTTLHKNPRRIYEVVFLLRHDAMPRDITYLDEKFESISAACHGKVLAREYWGLRDLAYRIKKNRKAHYYQYIVEVGNAAVDEMNKVFELHDAVIRHIILKSENHVPGSKSVMLQSLEDKTVKSDVTFDNSFDIGNKSNAKEVVEEVKEGA